MQDTDGNLGVPYDCSPASSVATWRDEERELAKTKWWMRKGSKARAAKKEVKYSPKHGFQIHPLPKLATMPTQVPKKIGGPEGIFYCEGTMRIATYSREPLAPRPMPGLCLIELKTINCFCANKGNIAKLMA